MIWFVYINSAFCGTVIAVDEDEALRFAQAKFPVGWNGMLTIAPRRRKRV